MAIRPEVHADKTAGQRKGVDAAVAHQEDLEGQLLGGFRRDLAALARRFEQRLPDTLQVLQQRRVVQVVRVAADLAHDLVAQVALGAEAEVLGRGLAQRRQPHLRHGASVQRQAGAQRGGQDGGAHARRRGEIASSALPWRGAAAHGGRPPPLS